MRGRRSSAFARSVCALVVAPQLPFCTFLRYPLTCMLLNLHIPADSNPSVSAIFQQLNYPTN